MIVIGGFNLEPEPAPQTVPEPKLLRCGKCNGTLGPSQLVSLHRSRHWSGKDALLFRCDVCKYGGGCLVPIEGTNWAQRMLAQLPKGEARCCADYEGGRPHSPCEGPLFCAELRDIGGLVGTYAMCATLLSITRQEGCQVLHLRPARPHDISSAPEVTMRDMNYLSRLRKDETDSAAPEAKGPADGR